MNQCYLLELSVYAVAPLLSEVQSEGLHSEGPCWPAPGAQAVQPPRHDY